MNHEIPSGDAFSNGTDMRREVAFDLISEFGNTKFGPRLANLIPIGPRCDTPNCDRPIYARHLCRRCYQVYNRHVHSNEICKTAGCNRLVSYSGRCRRCNDKRSDKRVPKPKLEIIKSLPELNAESEADYRLNDGGHKRPLLQDFDDGDTSHSTPADRPLFKKPRLDNNDAVT